MDKLPSDNKMVAFDIGIATIFAREVLEGSIIISQYRTVLLRSSEWEGERQRLALRTITLSAIGAGFVAFALCLIVGIVLAILGNDLDDQTSQLIEGISKIVAAICILQLSLKLPKWLGVYPSTSRNKELGLTLREIRFNVAWNIWREVAECGVFLIPYFLAGSIEEIPLSAIIGVAISLVLSLLMAYANRTGSQYSVCIFMTLLTSMLSTGLFVGGCHEFEEALGETPQLWYINGNFWDKNKFPMTMFYPFGYTQKPTVLHIVTLISWAALTICLHIRKYRLSVQAAAQHCIEESVPTQEEREEQEEEMVIKNGPTTEGSRVEERGEDENTPSIATDFDEEAPCEVHENGEGDLESPCIISFDDDVERVEMVLDK